MVGLVSWGKPALEGIGLQCRWAVLVNQLLTKPPTNGALCTAWILQGPFDLSTWLNWYMFYNGQQGVRDSFLNLWEYLAGDHLMLFLHRWST